MHIIDVVTYNVYGIIDPKYYLQDRLEHIISTILTNGTPDIICLQEATEPVINGLSKRLPHYHIWTKLDTLELNKLSPTTTEQTTLHGYLVLFSRWSFIYQHVVYGGSYYDDGLMKVCVDSERDLGFNLIIFNVHLNGGTFGKSEEVIFRKFINRLKESRMLEEAISSSIPHNLIVMGDFNYDSNNLAQCPEATISPEHTLNNVYDVWRELHPKEMGATEDEVVNTFRAAMKIKPPEQKRKVRYDKILYHGSIDPIEIQLIGDKPIQKKVLIEGKDSTGKLYTNITSLFPSDHFGLWSRFVTSKEPRKSKASSPSSLSVPQVAGPS